MGPLIHKAVETAAHMGLHHGPHMAEENPLSGGAITGAAAVTGVAVALGAPITVPLVIGGAVVGSILGAFGFFSEGP